VSVNLIKLIMDNNIYNIINKFDNDREDINSKIISYINDSKDISNCSDVMVLLLSERQILIEYISNINANIVEIDTLLKVKRKDRYIYYMQDYDLRLDKSQRETFIDSDLIDDIRLKDILFNHVNFLKESVATLDKLFFSIKWKLSLKEFEL
jgi:hypothetical protein